MKYLTFEDKCIDIFSEEFTDAKEAILKLSLDWDRLSYHDREDYITFCVIESCNPDEDAPEHFDGDDIFTIKMCGEMSPKHENIIKPVKDYLQKFPTNKIWLVNDMYCMTTAEILAKAKPDDIVDSASDGGLIEIR